tara:strand:- start:639 stop:1331 length:693 start_codon:yes stop_codon:yes gene_type:complete
MLKDLIKSAYEKYDKINDNINDILIKYYQDDYKKDIDYNPNFEIAEDMIKNYLKNNYEFKVQRTDNGRLLVIYDKNLNQNVLEILIRSLFDYIIDYKTLYWSWANISRYTYNDDNRKLWEYAYGRLNSHDKNIDNNEIKLIKLIFLNSGLIINNDVTLNLIFALISYIIKKKLICINAVHKEDKIKSDEYVFKTHFKFNNIHIIDKKYKYIYFYSVVSIREYVNNKWIEH